MVGFAHKWLPRLFLGLLISQSLVNLTGALGPELGFDALWYHLTEAKLFLEHRSIAPLPGNLLYWSGFPRLMEMIYAGALLVWDERLAKLIHWAFGVSCSYLVFKLGIKYLKNSAQALAATVLFYTSLIVGWLSTTAYVDLTVTAFILAAILVEAKLWRILWLTLAGATKLTAIPYSLVIAGFPWAALGALPFWLSNWRLSHNPFYPFGPPAGGFAPVGEWFTGGFWFWLSRPLRLFFDPSFRLGPIILILTLISVFKTKSLFTNRYWLLAIGSFLIWFFLPGTDFGRFALPLLALMSIFAGASLSLKSPLRYIAIILIFLQAGLGILGRAGANKKYLPVILGQQSKTDFLASHLNFGFGDFYDIDGYFAKNIKATDRVLIYNIHNLYYVNFPFDHESWAKPGTFYSHILVGQNGTPPPHLGKLPLIYANPITRIKLYSFNRPLS